MVHYDYTGDSMKTYTINKLIDGYKIRPDFTGKIMACCKAGSGYTHIKYENEIMELPQEPAYSLVFPDKFSKGTYYLDYYIWNPVETDKLFGSL